MSNDHYNMALNKQGFDTNLDPRNVNSRLLPAWSRSSLLRKEDFSPDYRFCAWDSAAIIISIPERRCSARYHRPPPTRSPFAEAAEHCYACLSKAGGLAFHHTLPAESVYEYMSDSPVVVITGTNPPGFGAWCRFCASLAESQNAPGYITSANGKDIRAEAPPCP